MASSLPGMIKSIGSGSELVSAIAIIGMPSFLASNTANLSLTVSNITSKSGFPDKFLIPPILESNLSFSLDRSNNSFFERLFAILSSPKILSNSSKRLIELEIVFQLVNVPPSHLLLI